MACRSVNNLQLSKDDMRRVYRDQARRRGGGVKIGHIIEILDVLVPVIPHFFGPNRANANNYSNRCSMGYSGEDDMSFHGHGRHGMSMASRDDIESDRYGFGMAYGDADGGRYGHGMSYGNVSGKAHAEDYGDRFISEEEFERLLDYAQQRNVMMY